MQESQLDKDLDRLAWARAVVLACWLATPAVQAQAQGQPDLLIGISMPLSGFNAGAGQEGLAVAKAVVDNVNQGGGIAGRKLKRMVLDDAFNAEKASANTRLLIDAGAVAIVNCWGTSSCSAMMPVVSQAGVPMVSGIAGGGPMRQSPGRYAFNLRATTEREIAHMVNQMLTVGQDQIALVYQGDAFGKSGQTAAAAVCAAARTKPVAELAVTVAGSNVPAVIAALAKLPRLNGVVLVAAPPATLKLITQTRAAGQTVQFYNLAAQANQKLVSDLGKHTAGVVFTTLVPSPWSVRHPVAKAYQQLDKAASGTAESSYLGREVFINAKVLVEGLRRAGPQATRESLARALESLPELRYGPMGIKDSAGDHQGASYVGLTIINRDGRFME